jgi:WD40 repeat protein
MKHIIPNPGRSDHGLGRGGHETRAAPALGGWLPLCAWLSVAGIGWSMMPSNETGKALAVQEVPFAQIARDDQHAQVWSLAYSGNTYVASATVTGDVWLKEIATGKSYRVQRGPIGSARSLAFSARSQVLAVAGGGPAVRLWDLERGAELKPLEVEAEMTKRVAFSPDGALLAVAAWGDPSECGTVTVWDWRHRRRLAALGGQRAGVNALAFSPDGSVIVTGNTVGIVKLSDALTGRERLRVKAAEVGQGGVGGVAFSPDGTLLATAGSLEHVVRLWDAATGELRATIPGTTFCVNAVTFSPDGKLLALARGDGTAVFWGVEEARVLGQVQARGGSVYSLAFSGDGRVLATGSMDGTLRLWDVPQVLGGKALALETRASNDKTASL